jgi:hypothetical protein
VRFVLLTVVTMNFAVFLECHVLSLIYCYRRFGRIFLFNIRDTHYLTARRHVTEDNFHLCKSLREIDGIKIVLQLFFFVKSAHSPQFMTLKIRFSVSVVVIPKMPVLSNAVMLRGYFYSRYVTNHVRIKN